ncbi:alpha/beta fold hydrolase [Pseudomonas sp. CBMAI 2609]|uniref:Alpha/beta fold hydrolase n=1 Tax=Pseudomonas flavocrustae TaxID=2991719 RepID=A0ABT6IKI7_9PSED|nr:alpha/beta fold hydrolase [Pseudomonas sp. CBMAI 2609]MDH4764105.1 alpha/beta fold hydrolase [Pseudomonas sp. CBMAI 2609]
MFGTLALFFFTINAFASSDVIGFRALTLTDSKNERPLELVIWYPSFSSAQPQLIADTPVFVGVLAAPNAAPASGPHPLVVLSHGFRGNWGNLSWLASALAHQGYIVAAVNHPGTTTHNRNPEAAEQLWQRPVDLQRAIDSVLSQPEHVGLVASSKIAVVGHSLGGWTALEIAGARFDPDLFSEDCRAHSDLASCSVYKQTNPNMTATMKASLAADMRDRRIAAVVSLDLGLSRGLTSESLAALQVPTLVIAAGEPSKDLPARLESADLASRLPPELSRYVEVSDANHFSFISVCKPGALALLAEEGPEEDIICRDGKSARPRTAIQHQVISLISGFLTQSFRDDKN